MADLLLSQLEQGKPVKVEKDGKTICVARVGDEVFAVDDTCSHHFTLTAYMSTETPSQLKSNRGK